MAAADHSRKKRILVDVHYLLVAQTGIKTYINELTTALMHSGNPHYDYQLVPSKPIISRRYYQKKGLFRSLMFHLETFIWKQFLLPLIVSFRKVDVVICPDYYAPMWRLRARKVVVFHDAFFWENTQDYNPLWLSYYRKMIQLGLRGNSKLVTVSEQSARKVAQHIPEGTVINTIHTGVSFPDSSSGKPHPLGGKAFFLHVGVFEKRKNLPFLVRVFAEFRQQESEDFHLVLVGAPGPKEDMDDFENVSQMVKELKLEGKVLMPGYVSKDELEAYYEHAIAYLFPSTSEGFGLPILEAFHAHLPVIVNNEDALVEIGGDGVLVASCDDQNAWVKQMSRVLDSSCRQQLIESGTTRLKHFSGGRFAREIEEMFDK